MLGVMECGQVCATIVEDETETNAGTAAAQAAARTAQWHLRILLDVAYGRARPAAGPEAAIYDDVQVGMSVIVLACARASVRGVCVRVDVCVGACRDSAARTRLTPTRTHLRTHAHTHMHTHAHHHALV
jgi:hypothetical protein